MDLPPNFIRWLEAAILESTNLTAALVETPDPEFPPSAALPRAKMFGEMLVQAKSTGRMPCPFISVSCETNMMRDGSELYLQEDGDSPGCCDAWMKWDLLDPPSAPTP